jgi:hypothetical protein
VLISSVREGPRCSRVIGPKTETTRGDSRYRVIAARTVRLDPATRPFVGLSGADERVADFRREQGYLVDQDPDASSCTVCIEAELAARNDAQLIEHIESKVGPLLKFARWPAVAKSALCLAGDLDALSLRD